MRVLQLSKFFPPFRGGIESMVGELTDGLHACGIDVKVLCASTDQQTHRSPPESRYPVIRVGTWARLKGMSLCPLLPWHLWRMSRDREIIHVHMPDPMSALALWLTRPTARLVVHWHSDVVRQRILLRLYAPLQNWLLRRAAAVVCTSQAYADSSPWLAAYKDKIEVIPIGVKDHAPWVRKGLVERIRATHPGQRLIFALGRMAYYKGFDVLIKAAAQLPDNITVLVGGTGELLDRYRQEVVRSGLGMRIQFLGDINADELPSYFAASDVFCLPSVQRSEAYGVVLVEAMAMSRPIVCTSVPGTAMAWINLNEQTGLVIPPEDSSSLAQALTIICADSALARRMGETGRRRYEQELGGDIMVRRTLALYQRLVGAPTGISFEQSEHPNTGNRRP